MDLAASYCMGVIIATLLEGVVGDWAMFLELDTIQRSRRCVGNLGVGSGLEGVALASTS